MVSPLNAVTETPMSCMLSARFCAVTMTSSMTCDWAAGEASSSTATGTVRNGLPRATAARPGLLTFMFTIPL